MATCNVLIEAISAGGALRPGVTVGFFGSVPTGVGLQVIDNSIVTVITDEGGEATAALEQGALVRVIAPALGIDGLTLLIPMASDANFWTLVAAAIADPPTPANPFALEADLLAEVTRAEGAEADIAGDLTAETNAREAADTILQGNIDAEVARATGAESGLGTAIAARQPLSQKGVANGYAGLDGGGKVPTAQLPSLAAPSSATPQAVATAGAVGSGVPYSREDHVHALTETIVRQVLATLTAAASFNGQQVSLGGLDLAGLTGVQPYQWPPNPAFHGVRVNTVNGSFAIIGAGDGTAYFWDPVNNAGGTANSDNFANQGRTFTVDPGGNVLVSTLKLGGSGAVAISESPAGVLQATAGDLSTPVTMRFGSITITDAAPTHGAPGIEGEVRLDGSHIFRYTGGAWFEAPLTFTAV